MPGPRGLPDETVTPEVSLCSRIPDSRLPTKRATSACDPSWAWVIRCRVASHNGRTVTSTSAITAVVTIRAGGAGSLTADTASHADPSASGIEARVEDTGHLPSEN